MRQLLLIAYCPLNEDLREDFAHEGTEIGVAFPQFEVLLVEQDEGNHYLEHALLIVDTVELAEEGGYEL